MLTRPKILSLGEASVEMSTQVAWSGFVVPPISPGFDAKTSTILIPALLTKAPNKARETGAADPIANPWLCGKVVF